MDTARLGAHQDFLTRTALHLGRSPATASLAHVVHALQRVPGVLTVAVDAVNGRALVAHDSAVPLASLVAAVNSVGESATVVAGSVDGAAPADAPSFVGKLRRIKGAVVLAILAVIVVDMTFLKSPAKLPLFLVLVALLWALVITEGLVARRRSE
jgi:copper chaperone CopZ